MGLWWLLGAAGAVAFAASAWVLLQWPGDGPPVATRVRLGWLAAGAGVPVGLGALIGAVAERTDFVGDGVMFLIFLVAVTAAFAIGFERAKDRRAWVFGHGVAMAVGLSFVAIVIAVLSALSED